MCRLLHAHSGPLVHPRRQYRIVLCMLHGLYNLRNTATGMAAAASCQLPMPR